MKLIGPRRHASVPLAFADHMDRIVLFFASDPRPDEAPFLTSIALPLSELAES